MTDASASFHAVPGIMDNFVMLSAGDLIDNTLGVKFGLATLTAAACGQVVRNTNRNTQNCYSTVVPTPVRLAYVFACTVSFGGTFSPRQTCA